MASDQVIRKTVEALVANGIECFVVDSGLAAFEKIKELIPKGVTVMNGASRTLEQIGFLDYLKSGKHGWKNLHEAIYSESDPAKRVILRKEAELSDYYLGSVNALTETGEFINASNSGSQLPHIVYTSQNLIFVVGVQKIVPTMAEAMKRLEQYVVPLEDENMKKKYGLGTSLNKIVIFKRENPKMGRKVRMILVKEVLGF